MNKNVVIKPLLFDDRDAIKFEVVQGATINDFIEEAKLPVAVRGHVRASLNGVPCVLEDFDIPLKPDDLVNIYIVPMGCGGGGKSILRVVAMIAVVWIAPYAVSALS